MNEGKGLMLRIGLDYKKGKITKELLIQICKENRWDYKFDNHKKLQGGNTHEIYV